MSEMVQIEAEELRRLRAIEREYRDKWCERCGLMSMRVVVITCAEEPCPRRKLLSREDMLWRGKPGSVLSRRRLPVATETP